MTCARFEHERFALASTVKIPPFQADPVPLTPYLRLKIEI